MSVLAGRFVVCGGDRFGVSGEDGGFFPAAFEVPEDRPDSTAAVGGGAVGLVDVAAAVPAAGRRETGAVSGGEQVEAGGVVE
ncbi:MAG: hypothetical protein ACKVWR_00535 [Acidimicrobiales bacterium]